MATPTTSYIPTYERWRILAACQESDVNVFFPEAEEARQPLPAGVLICRTCPVKVACFEYAVRNRIKNGIWGGVVFNGKKLTKFRSTRLDIVATQEGQFEHGYNTVAERASV